MVYGKVALLEYRGNLKLVRCHLVVARLAWDRQFEGLDFEIFHECLHTVGDGSEVVVVHLLVLCRVVSHEGSAG